MNSNTHCDLMNWGLWEGVSGHNSTLMNGLVPWGGRSKELGEVVHVCNLSIQESKEGRWQTRWQPGLNMKTLLKQKKKQQRSPGRSLSTPVQCQAIHKSLPAKNKPSADMQTAGTLIKVFLSTRTVQKYFSVIFFTTQLKVFCYRYPSRLRQ